MKREDSLEKRWILKLILNFRGNSSDTASTFLKMARCSHNYNLLWDVIDKDDITSVNIKTWEDPL